ncbi:MAG: alanine racemase, partial [Verrucomicrobiia bacterium]
MKRCWLEISQSHLLHNLKVLRSLLPQGAQVAAVVKANAYGHGAVEVARWLESEVAMLAVANCEEAMELQAAGIQTPILVLGPALPEERSTLVEAGFVPSLSSFAEAQAFNDLGEALGKKVPVHIVIDTGMGRMGIWQEEFSSVFARISKLPNLVIAGIATHLPVADEEDDFTNVQLDWVRVELSKVYDMASGGGTWIHVLNSAGVEQHAEAAWNMVRLGLALYGYSPTGRLAEELRPVMTWKTRVTLVREIGPGRSISYGRTFVSQKTMKVATLAVGYADGYPRAVSNRGAEVLLRGRRCPVLGRVTMDQVVVDVSEVEEVEVGDEVVLFGEAGKEILP